VIKLGYFPVPESVKANFKQAWVRQFQGSAFRVLSNVVFWEFIGPSPKTLRLLRGSKQSIFSSLVVTFHIRGLLPFSGSFRMIMFFSMSMSVQSKRFASPLLMAVSFNSCRKAEFFLPEAAINASSSFSNGINGNFLVTRHLGFSQVRLLSFRN